MEEAGEAGLQRVDESLLTWRQGDCVLGEHWFAHRIHPKLPLTPEAEEAAKADVDLAEAEVRGLVVISQACDIVRDCASRPFVEVCPLVAVDETKLREIQRGGGQATATSQASPTGCSWLISTG